MDLSCIISSGDLELYVLGMLPPEEAYKIEQLALLFPEVKAEIDAISASLESMASGASVAPPASVKGSLMNKLAQMKSEEERGTAPVIPMAVPPVETRSGPPVRSIHRRTAWVTAASLAGLIASIAVLFYLANLNRQKNREIAVLQQRVDTLNKNYTAGQRQLQAYEETVQVMHNGDYRRIALAPVPGKPKAVVDVFWKPQTGEVFVVDVSLPAAAAGKQYQLWAIVNGQPVDAGLLSDTKMQVQKMKGFQSAEAFAITLEKEGGSPTPTMSAMYVLGKTS